MVEDFLARLEDGNYTGTHGLRLKREGKPGPAQRKLFAKRLLNERFREWSVDETNDVARWVKERFINLSRRLSEEALTKLLETAESIAAAERAKSHRNPKVDGKRYTRLSRAAVLAARLAKELGEMFPPPWEEETAPIGELVAGLNAFSDGALTSTILGHREKDIARRRASKKIQLLRDDESSTGHGGATWELMRDLAWFATGMQRAPIDESTIRRYLNEERKTSRGLPDHAYWNRNWPLLVDAARLVPARNSDPFEAAAIDYLKQPFSSSTSRRKAARKRS